MMTSKLGLATQARFAKRACVEINRGPQEKARLPSNTKPEFREGPAAAAVELTIHKKHPHASNPIAFATMCKVEMVGVCEMEVSKFR
jgi:hypothetical protein